jgi:hypothetical protein
MTHTQKTPTSVDYRDLTHAQQATFDLVMELADNAGPGDAYPALMLAAAALAGISIEYGGGVLKCSCTCVCATVFDNDHPDARTIEESGGFNLPIRQCPLCADRHPAPAQD